MNTQGFCPPGIRPLAVSLKQTQPQENLKTGKDLSAGYFNNLVSSRLCSIPDKVTRPRLLLLSRGGEAQWRDAARCTGVKAQ